MFACSRIRTEYPHSHTVTDSLPDISRGCYEGYYSHVDMASLHSSSEPWSCCKEPHTSGMYRWSCMRSRLPIASTTPARWLKLLPRGCHSKLESVMLPAKLWPCYAMRRIVRWSTPSTDIFEAEPVKELMLWCCPPEIVVMWDVYRIKCDWLVPWTRNSTKTWRRYVSLVTKEQKCNALFFGKNKKLRNYLFNLIVMIVTFMLLHILFLN
jgi:hypothetical protein